ncbi:unnamed protein product [Heterobilharzia americana]|nr:unnamed protein product [Heterobilharzia americana]
MSHTYSEFNDNVTKTDEICGNKTIDRKTRQVLFFECSMDFIQQTFLRKSEKFNEQRATQLLEKYKQRHRKIKCSAYFLIDRIRFKRKRPIGIRPFRKEVIYREIKHFFVFPNYPEVFMICIVDENKNRRSYESFQCANSDTVSTVCCLTYKASIDVNNILRDTLSIEQISVSPLSSTTDHSSANELEYSTLNTLLNATNDSGNTDSDFVEPPKALGSDYIIDGEQMIPILLVAIRMSILHMLLLLRMMMMMKMTKLRLAD